jgi:serine/threonine protein kinase
LDKSFGYNKNFGAKYELGKEVGRGHFGHTCAARAKKGDLKDQPVAVKIISKSKVNMPLNQFKFFPILFIYLNLT